MHRVKGQGSGWRKPILRYILGMSTDQHTDVLKNYLAEARVAEPGAKLDVVMIESMEHYEELLLRDGVPLAREWDGPPAGYVRLKRRTYRWLLAGLLIGFSVTPLPWRWPQYAHDFSQLLHWLGG